MPVMETCKYGRNSLEKWPSSPSPPLTARITGRHTVVLPLEEIRNRDTLVTIGVMGVHDNDDAALPA